MRHYLRVSILICACSGLCQAQTAAKDAEQGAPGVAPPVPAAVLAPPTSLAGPVAALPQPTPNPMEQSTQPTQPEALSFAPSSATSMAHSTESPIRSQLPVVEKRWYGWQTLLTDTAAIGIGVAGANQNSLALGLGGVGLGLLGTPAVHAAHGNWGRAGASFGMRAAVPLLGYTVLQAGSGLDSAGEAILLTAVGAIAVVVIDAAALAYDEVPATKPTVNLAVSACHEGASLRVSGTF